VPSVIALVRPDAWNFPLLVHVFGAMVLVGALVLAGSALVLAWRDGNPVLVRLGYRSLLLGALPAWVLMRAGAGWIASKEGLTDSNATWIGIGESSADLGLLLILVSTLLAGLAMRRIRRSSVPGPMARAPAGLVSLLLVVYLVAIWAMTTKPT
jgi:hypothetical protein